MKETREYLVKVDYAIDPPKEGQAGNMSSLDIQTIMEKSIEKLMVDFEATLSSLTSGNAIMNASVTGIEPAIEESKADAIVAKLKKETRADRLEAIKTKLDEVLDLMDTLANELEEAWGNVEGTNLENTERNQQLNTNGSIIRDAHETIGDAKDNLDDVAL